MADVQTWELDGHDNVGGRVQLEVDDRLRTMLHEIRQPVAAVLALAEAARGLPGTSTEVGGYLDRIIGQIQEVSSAAWSVLERDDAGTPMDLGEVVDSVLDAFALTWTGTLTRRGRLGRLRTTAGRSIVRRAVVNVVDNAVRAAGPQGTVMVTTETAGGQAQVVVEDDGPGFGRVRRGTGLGLRVSREGLGEFGGTIAIDRSAQLGGVRVVVGLPLCGLAVRPPPAAEHDRLPRAAR